MTATATERFKRYERVTWRERAGHRLEVLDDDGRTTTCRDCAGFGQVELPHPAEPYDIEPGRSTCPRCNGVGSYEIVQVEDRDDIFDIDNDGDDEDGRPIMRPLYERHWVRRSELERVS